MRGVPAFAAALLLAAGVAAAVSAVTVRVSLSKKRATDRKSYVLPSLTADYVTRSLREGGDSKKALAAARAWAVRLEEALARTVAKRRGVVLLTAGAVAAGAEDLTARGRGGDGGEHTSEQGEEK